MATGSHARCSDQLQNCRRSGAKIRGGKVANPRNRSASSKEGADQVVNGITKEGGKAIAVQADVAKQKDIKHLFAETKKAFGRLDILVNNAGVYQFAPLKEATEDQLHRQFGINVFGLILATREALKYFGAEGGSVINIGSVVSS
ncbi:MAG TPA: SDR family NAD(P)-dependent oxidoreductase [Pyrinomonadaceae bacterium]|nr:SDR family NAD(P)-dependent oxidoreductase [Pyrinomonadaceae bacterium]